MPIHKPFQPTTGTKAKRPNIKAKRSENPAIDAEESKKEFEKSTQQREMKLSKSNPKLSIPKESNPKLSIPKESNEKKEKQIKEPKYKSFADEYKEVQRRLLKSEKDLQPINPSHTYLSLYHH